MLTYKILFSNKKLNRAKNYYIHAVKFGPWLYEDPMLAKSQIHCKVVTVSYLAARMERLLT